MKLSRTGVIINTERYEACVAFYRDLFGLEILFTKGDYLTCFDFQGSYLMIETEGGLVAVVEDHGHLERERVVVRARARRRESERREQREHESLSLRHAPSVRPSPSAGKDVLRSRRNFRGDV